MNRFELLGEEILHISERQREPDIQYHRKADYVGTGFEILEWVAVCHARNLNSHLARLKQ